jgi:tellurite resistance protein TerC
MRALWPWIAFNAVVLAILAVDLGLFNRNAHRVTPKEASLWSAVWVAMALAFGGVIFVVLGAHAGTEFFTGYLIEYSLSVDNIFVFVLMFSVFGTKEEHQHRVLFWGIIGALVMRGAMIGAGVALITRFHWVMYIFGAFLMITGVRMAIRGEENASPETNPVLIFIRRLVPVWPHYEGEQFFHRGKDDRGIVRTMATPLFVVLLLIEVMDLVFAVDSIPAVFSVTQDPFIVYTSNVCAILGLRSLYFLLADMIHRVRYLRYGLAVVLVFIGAKMLASWWYDFPTLASLVAISLILGSSVVVSLLFSRGEAG